METGKVGSLGRGTVGYSARMSPSRAAIVFAVATASWLSACSDGKEANDPSSEVSAGRGAAATPASEHAEQSGAHQSGHEGGHESADLGDATSGAVTTPVVLGPVHQLVVRDLDGNPFPLSKLAGRPMIIEIWATWCGPCRKNRATVHELLPTMPKRLAIVGISVDAGSNLVKNFLKSNPANEFELMATPEFMEFVSSRNPSPSIPKTMYVDSKGRVADLAEGTQSAKWLAAMAKNLR